MSDQDHDPNDAPEPGPLQPTPEQPKLTGTRRLSRKGMTRSRKRELDDHAKVEGKRKTARRLSKTPSRDDVARAVLHIILWMLYEKPHFSEGQKLQRFIIRLLKRALFDEAEIERVIADMIVRTHHDRVKWLHGRACKAWRAGGYQGPQPKRPPLPKHISKKTPRREDGTMPWTKTTPRLPRSRKASQDEAA